MSALSCPKRKSPPSSWKAKYTPHLCSMRDINLFHELKKKTVRVDKKRGTSTKAE
jgi:hypothetical protein